jgi:uncharacterized membrane protein YfcA
MFVLGVVGLLAQFVDGALGMAYGVTSSTLLLFAGIAPAAASASVHLSEIATTLASGASHWRFGNVEWVTVRRVAVPGAIGGFTGAVLLSSISGDVAAPYASGILLLLGLYILVRFTTGKTVVPTSSTPLRRRILAPLGLFAGFVDAVGGGGWGPVATPALLASGRMEPRKVIGSVDTSEFVVALAASVGFLLTLGTQGVNAPIVLALLTGGLIAAPIAAFVVRKVPPRALGAAVGGMIVLTNTRTILRALEVPGSMTTPVYLTIWVVWAAALSLAAWQLYQERVGSRSPLPVIAESSDRAA